MEDDQFVVRNNRRTPAQTDGFFPNLLRSLLWPRNREILAMILAIAGGTQELGPVCGLEGKGGEKEKRHRPGKATARNCECLEESHVTGALSEQDEWGLRGQQVKCGCGL